MLRCGPRLPPAQMRYKYQLYVDGHCAAMRYASMMCLGAVIMKARGRRPPPHCPTPAPSPPITHQLTLPPCCLPQVDSVTKADSMWFFPLLRPYDWRSASPDPSGDHVRVAADLSDLFELIAWAKAHDAECERIAANAGALYTSVVAQEGQLDYMQVGACGGGTVRRRGRTTVTALLHSALITSPHILSSSCTRFRRASEVLPLPLRQSPYRRGAAPRCWRQRSGTPPPGAAQTGLGPPTLRMRPCAWEAPGTRPCASPGERRAVARAPAALPRPTRRAPSLLRRPPQWQRRHR